MLGPTAPQALILKPMNKRLSTRVLVTLSCAVSPVAAALGHSGSCSDETSLFDAPEALLTADSPFTGHMYPSPVLRDIDGDGKAELVVGDLLGRVRFASREGKGLKWSKLEAMKSGDEPLRLNNW